MSSVYCDRDRIEQVYGAEHIAQYAKMDGNDSEATITARINLAIAFAGDEIDGVARKAAYQNIPLVDASDATPNDIANLAAVLAGLWLYEAKGSHDTDGRSGRALHRLQFRRAWARRRLNEIREGEYVIDAV
jgi:hypothetical protein